MTVIINEFEIATEPPPQPPPAGQAAAPPQQPAAPPPPGPEDLLRALQRQRQRQARICAT